MKNADIGEGTKVPHLSYVGDATIGDCTNIGAGDVFVNYDGEAKHHTTIGEHAATGSDNMFVAPVELGDGAYTAAGSVITKDVPPGRSPWPGASSAISRAGWPRRRAGGRTAAAAATGTAAGPAGDRSGRGHRGRAAVMTGIKTTGEKKLMLFSGRAHPELAEEVAHSWASS